MYPAVLINDYLVAVVNGLEVLRRPGPKPRNTAAVINFVRLVDQPPLCYTDTEGRDCYIAWWRSYEGSFNTNSAVHS